MSVLAQSVGNLWRVMESYGLDPEPAFLAEGLNIQWPIAPGTRVPYEELDAVRANAAAASGDPAFGLRAGQCVHPSQLGALGYAVLASETLRDSFNRVARFARVISENGYIEVFERDQQLVCHIGTQAPSRNSGSGTMCSCPSWSPCAGLMPDRILIRFTSQPGDQSRTTGCPGKRSTDALCNLMQSTTSCP